MPGAGMTPALRPNCPGVHCPFCCADTVEAAAGIKQTRTPTSVIRKLMVVLLWLDLLFYFLYPLKSSPGLIFGYSLTLRSYSPMILKSGANIQPLVRSVYHRLESSCGSLLRSYIIGSCGLR